MRVLLDNGVPRGSVTRRISPDAKSIAVLTKASWSFEEITWRVLSPGLPAPSSRQKHDHGCWRLRAERGCPSRRHPWRVISGPLSDRNCNGATYAYESAPVGDSGEEREAALTVPESRFGVSRVRGFDPGFQHAGLARQVTETSEHVCRPLPAGRAVHGSAFRDHGSER